MRVLDRNDEPPAFYSAANGTRADRAGAALDENSPPGTTLTVPLVLRDPDLVGGALEATFSEPSGTFELAREPAVGEPIVLRVRSNATLDHETMPTYSATLRVCDEAMEMLNGARERCAEAKIDLLVRDVNEQPPVLERQLENLTLREDTALGPITAIQLAARDPDSGVNAIVSYSFGPKPRDVAPNAVTGQTHFSIDPKTGQVSLVQRLDAAKQGSFFLPIRLSNSDARPPLHSDYVLYITGASSSILFAALANSIVMMRLKQK